jgi:hypothetical protein
VFPSQVVATDVGWRCHDGLIVGNSFEGGGTSVQTKGGSRNIEIRGNVFRENGGRAVNMGGATGFEFFRPPLDAAGDNYEARDIRVIANVFDRSAEVAAMPGCVDCLFAHNTVYRPGSEELDYQGATVMGTLAAADPSLVEATSGDFTLVASSPRLGAGVALPEAPQDFVGTCYGAPPTIGAFERQP